MRTWRTDQLLWLLRFLRLVVALTSTSLIARRPRSSLASRCLTPSQHPDEHFQNSEVAADLVFDFPYRLARTWEWQPEHPCRSIVPVWLSTGWAFALLRCFVDVPSGRTLLLVQRAAMWALSVVAELAADRISPRATRSKLLFSASLGGLAFLCRPLSNSLAALLLVPLFASAEVIVRSSLSSARDPVSSRYLDGFWMLLALGIWCRVDFIAFALPSVVQVGLACLSPGAKSVGATFRRARFLTPILASLALIACDTLFFATSARAPWWPVITPLNSLLYNISSSNLAKHGTHPRWLHLLVNWPILFGAALPIVALYGEVLDHFEVPLWTLVSGTALLSVQPHQEPRFLLPLIVPLCDYLGSVRRLPRFFSAAGLLHTVLATAFFAYLHQGGLIPALLEVNSALSSSVEPVRVVVWQTYMPPRHLVLPIAGPAHEIVDLAGAPWSTAHARLASSAVETWLVAPEYAVSERACLSAWSWSNRAIHLDPDDLGVILTTGWDRASVGVWTVRSGCL